MSKIFTPNKVSLSKCTEINEAMIQDMIAEDPSIIGLGDLILRDKERHQPKAGRLDLLLQDPDNNRRYEVEIQLGKCDESHIIRTIEYWDIERRRYPQYDHCAVIIAEDITSRFLNVISLFNGHIPLIAIQLNGFKVEEKVALIFTTVLDELPLGLVDEDEDVALKADRDYWLTKGSESSLKLADDFLKLIKEVGTDYEFNYNKSYIGLVVNGKARNFVVIRAKKKHILVDFKMPQDEATALIFEENEIDLYSYQKRWGRYRAKLNSNDIVEKSEFLQQMLKKAEAHYNA